MIEMGKKYQTRDGRAVRILATDYKNRYGGESVLAVVMLEDGTEKILLTDLVGSSNEAAAFDLIPVPTKREGWVLLSLGEKKEPLSVLFDSLEEAEEMSYSKSVGMKRPIVAHVTWED